MNAKVDDGFVFCTAGSIEYTGLLEVPESGENLSYQSATALHDCKTAFKFDTAFKVNGNSMALYHHRC